MTFNKKQSKIKINNIGILAYLFISPYFLLNSHSFAQDSYRLDELEINRSFDLEDENNLDFPTNPFEIVDRLRRANSMNDATKPSDAIDNAIKSFDMINEDKQM